MMILFVQKSENGKIRPSRRFSHRTAHFMTLSKRYCKHAYFHWVFGLYVLLIYTYIEYEYTILSSDEVH